MLKTATLTDFFTWLLDQIPQYVDHQVKKEVSFLPKPKDGRDGKNGVSVVNSEIAADDHLVLTLSNGKIIDAGEMPAGRSGAQSAVHVAGNAWQIHVGDTPPANPYDNQIWFATNLTSACN